MFNLAQIRDKYASKFDESELWKKKMQKILSP